MRKWLVGLGSSRKFFFLGLTLCLVVWCIFKNHVRDVPVVVPEVEHHAPVTDVKAEHPGSVSKASNHAPVIYSENVNHSGQHTGADLETAQKYLKQAEYPPFTRPLRSIAEDPVVAAYEVHPKRMTLGEDAGGGGMAVSVWPEKLDFVYPEPVVLFAQSEGGSSEGLELTVKVLPPVGSGQTEQIATAKFEKVKGSLFRAVLDFPMEKGLEAVGAYTATVEWTAAGAQNSESTPLTVGFNISNPQARLTGQFRDEVKDGSLLIWAQVEVEVSGRYYLNGSLYNGDAPVAWAENAQQFESGLHWIPLTFYGKAIRDRAQDQVASHSYLLKHLSFARTGIFPNMRAALWTRPYATHHYVVSQFTAQPYNDPVLLETAQRMVPGKSKF